ncbi:CAP domain-containing protein [Sporodiniella umbellata]|nr:CAP domain-containing protein [Sporodiniella umbellata]
MSLRSLTFLLSFVAVILCTFVRSAEALNKATIKNILKKHNAVRAKHHAPALKWNRKLASYAQNWSNRCVFQHSQGDYGENLGLNYANWGQLITNGWYNEYKKYDYNNPGFGMATGHFTQVVWKGTTEVGCGVTVCDNIGKGYKLYTCSYNTPGNYQGEFETNVLRP